MKWFKKKQASEALGIPPRRVRTLADRGLIPVKYEGKHKFYGVTEKAGQDSQDIADAKKEVFFEKASDRYVFDTVTNTYIFFGLPDQPPTVKVGRDKIDALIRDYSNETGGATVNQLAGKYELSRATIKSIISWLGKTHDSAPFSDETLAITEEDELATSVLKAKEQRVLVKAQKKRLRRHEAVLDNEDWVRHFITDLMTTIPEHKVTKFKKKRVSNNQSYIAVLGLTDLHIGKRGIDGFNSKVAADRAIKTVMEASNKATKMWGTPDYWVITCGSDMLHVDNYQGTTQKGTPMDTDVDAVDMMSIAYRTMEYLVLHLQSYAPVKVVAMTGNHDRLLSGLLGMMIDARFHDDSNVEVLDGSRGSAYIRYGKSLLGFNHGDSIKPHNLPSVMSAERPKDWGECDGNWEWFCGHLHSLILRVSEHNGCRVWTMPALSGTDRWHKLNGYAFNRKQLAMFRVEPKSGVTAIELIEAKDEE